MRLSTLPLQEGELQPVPFLRKLPHFEFGCRYLPENIPLLRSERLACGFVGCHVQTLIHWAKPGEPVIQDLSSDGLSNMGLQNRHGARAAMRIMPDVEGL